VWGRFWSAQDRYGPALRLLYGDFGADGDRCMWAAAWQALQAPYVLSHIAHIAHSPSATLT